MSYTGTLIKDLECLGEKDRKAVCDLARERADIVRLGVKGPRFAFAYAMDEDVTDVLYIPVESFTTPGAIYTVTTICGKEEDNNTVLCPTAVACTCPAFHYNLDTYECKHMQRVEHRETKLHFNKSNFVAYNA